MLLCSAIIQLSKVEKRREVASPPATRPRMSMPYVLLSAKKHETEYKRQQRWHRLKMRKKGGCRWKLALSTRHHTMEYKADQRYGIGVQREAA